MKMTHFPRTQWLKIFTIISQIHHILRESEEDNLIENIRLFDDTNNKNETIIAVTE
jgi:hypothetical protein